MDSSLFLRSALSQALLVAALFAVLIALPLPDDFFEDYGFVSGPVAWIAMRRDHGADPLGSRSRSPASRRRPAGWPAR